ncbi:MAG: kynureninase [Saprospiraceae bacterium]
MNLTQQYALEQDIEDPLAGFRDLFHIPKTNDGTDSIYFCGNSLGLMPKSVTDCVKKELEHWKDLAVEGHFKGSSPWMTYHESLAKPMAEIVGALPSEVIVMNTLTVNLHLMMVSFYRPTTDRFKILVDYSPFPSDRYAIDSQIRFHGYDPSETLIELLPGEGEEIVSEDHIRYILENHGEEIALIIIGGVNYYTGQAYDIKSITQAGHRYGCKVGFDMAHAAGNLRLHLHDDGPDFAVWCTYKYINSGPGSLSGCFIHERHHNDDTLHRFAGWWGHDKASRFLMGDQFLPTQSAEGWQLSNTPILSMAPIKASLEIFHQANIDRLREKSMRLTAYLEYLIHEMYSDKINIITPSDPHQRGCQLSLQMTRPDKSLFYYLMEHGVILDWREPDVIRVAPTPLYNTFEDIWMFVNILQEGLKTLD